MLKIKNFIYRLFYKKHTFGSIMNRPYGCTMTQKEYNKYIMEEYGLVPLKPRRKLFKIFNLK